MEENIRNFVIIAHVDHGKSTFADRLLEITGTVEKRRMKAQYLDQLELERERGITIKMAPVRMDYAQNGTRYVLNLIDTPGHSDFSYEVSRALQAVEGAILLVDVTQGVQAQTLVNYRAARAAGLTVVGAVNKVDLMPHRDDPRLTHIRRDVAALLAVSASDIFLVSGKTGEGVAELLSTLVKKVPEPKKAAGTPTRALIFDSFYDDHKGVVASIRLFGGSLKSGETIVLAAKRAHSKAKEVGYFHPQLTALPSGGALEAGEIGYVATGIRDPAQIQIGDTMLAHLPSKTEDYAPFALHGYREPQPVVFVSFYPDDADDYELLTKGLQKLRLNDSSLRVEPDQNEVLGRGYKVGFLGRLHFEITSERLRREFSVATVNTFPSVEYRVRTPRGWGSIVKPEELPTDALEIEEPMVAVSILIPVECVPQMFALQSRYRMTDVTTATFQDRVLLSSTMPLAELVSDFDEQLKSLTSGYASFSYELAGYHRADIVRVDTILAGTLVPGLSRFLPRGSAEREARQMVERLKELLPRQQFAQAIQVSVEGRIIAREDIPALRKDVTGYLYGGDRTRKMKLWKKQKRGKERLQERARATIPPEVFKELLKK